MVPESDSPDAARTQSRAQLVKDYKLAVEYKWLKSQAPGGVYVLPQPDNLREWHGVIFVRRGMYSNGIFKFRMDLAPEYNDVGLLPRVRFTTPVFNPLVNPSTGELDLAWQFPEWNPEKHFVITVLTYLKKAFYFKDIQHPDPPNAEAATLFAEDKDAFLTRVEECVRLSQEDVHQADDGSVIRFKEAAPVHEQLSQGLRDAQERQTQASAEDPQVVSTRLNVLEIIRRLRREESRGTKASS